MSKLKKCPNCGSEAVKRKLFGGFVACENDGCNMAGPSDDPDGAKWNVVAGVAEELRRAQESLNEASVLIGRMAWGLERARPDSDLPFRARKWLKSKGLEGSPFRSLPGEPGDTML